MAGYSGTPLWKKLGIKPGNRLAIADAPPGFAIPDLPDDVRIDRAAPWDGPYDVLLAFAAAAADVDRHLTFLRPRMTPAAGLWIGWPKRASGVPTDVTEDAVRGKGLAAGLVDNKVCAIDDTWSGLRLVVRVRDRARA